MKVLHLWISDSPRFGGGGGGSMYRLHSNLREAGIESKILCENKTSGSPHVCTKPTINKIEKFIKKFTYRLGLNDIHRISSFRVKDHDTYKEADIVHFHGIHSGFLSYLALPSLTANKPAVFTLRDMWCLTGHCCVSYDCDRWKIGCGKCPYPKAYPPIKRDATRLEWKLKSWVYHRSNLNFVAVSHWQRELAKKSMINCFPIHHIYNGVNIEIFKPTDLNMCRHTLGLPLKKPIVLFVATHLNSHGKGIDLLIDALQSLPKLLKDKIVLLLMGKHGDTITGNLDMQSVDLGYIDDAHLRAKVYSAADVFVSPTRGESFALSILESIACGTPVVSFNLGPIPEIVRHGITGYTAEPENSKDLARGMVQLLEDKYLLSRMGKLGRSVAEKEYSSKLETQRYIQLYQQILEK